MTTNSKREIFHPLEISICGHSNSGKTTLIVKLIEMFSKRLTVGYIKHDAHQFSMDRENKDTFLAMQAGASQIAISSPHKTALLTKNQEHDFFFKHNYIDCDAVIIEGYKARLCSKILMWSGSDEDQALLKRYQSDSQHNLLAIVGTDETGPAVENIPYFQRDNTKGIYHFINQFWEEKISKIPLYGLVLTGGKSTRMGTDKGALNYHGKSQIAYLYELLSKVTDQTFVSCRADQTTSEHIKNYRTIEDRFLDFGPTGGILSAFHKYPYASWMVVACDMPFINLETITDLVNNRNPYRLATCFYNGEKKWPEPLCAIYEPKAMLKLGHYLSIGKPCPRKVLMNSRIQCLDLNNQNALNNINTPSEFKENFNRINGNI